MTQDTVQLEPSCCAGLGEWSITPSQAFSQPSGLREGRMWIRVSSTRWTMRGLPAKYSWHRNCISRSISSRPSTSLPWAPAMQWNSGSPLLKDGEKQRMTSDAYSKTSLSHCIREKKSLNNRNLQCQPSLSFQINHNYISTIFTNSQLVKYIRYKMYRKILDDTSHGIGILLFFSKKR